MPLEHLQPATRVQFGLGAVLQHSRTPSLRVAGFEDDDEDKDKNQNEVPCTVSCHSGLRLSRSGAPLDPIFRDTGGLQNQQPS